MQGQRTHVPQVNIGCNSGMVENLMGIRQTPQPCAWAWKQTEFEQQKCTEDIKGNTHVNGIATSGKYTFWKHLGFEILPQSRIYVVNLTKQAHICKECFQFSLPKWCIITIITMRLRMKVFLSGGGMKVGTVVIIGIMAPAPSEGLMSWLKSTIEDSFQELLKKKKKSICACMRRLMGWAYFHCCELNWQGTVIHW